MSIEVERTDTFAGEANYCWVRRATLPADVTGDAEWMSPLYKRRLAKAAKAAVGLEGVSGRWEWDYYGTAFRPRGMCQVLYINWRD